jgi:hypothetical protein
VESRQPHKLEIGGSTPPPATVTVAQLEEHGDVAPAVVSSNLIRHPADEALLLKPSLVMRKKVVGIHPSALMTEESMNEFLLFFAYGLVEDALAATYNKMVQLEKALLAGLSAFSIFAFGVYCLSLILPDFSFAHMRTWGFGLGNFCGTMAMVTYFKHQRRKGG